MEEEELSDLREGTGNTSEETVRAGMTTRAASITTVITTTSATASTSNSSRFQDVVTPDTQKRRVSIRVEDTDPSKLDIPKTQNRVQSSSNETLTGNYLFLITLLNCLSRFSFFFY